MKFSLRILNWLIIAYCSSILLISIISLNGSMALNKQKVLGFRIDYLLHVSLFIPWMILAKWRWGDYGRNKNLWYALGFGFLLAAFSEAIQLFLPDRSFNVIDLAANNLGICIGAMVAGWGVRSARQEVRAMEKREESR